MKKSNLKIDPAITAAKYAKAIDDLRSLLKSPTRFSPAVFCKNHSISSNVIRALMRMNIIRKQGNFRNPSFHWIGNSVMNTSVLVEKVREVVQQIYLESRSKPKVKNAAKTTKKERGIQALFEDALNKDVNFKQIGEYVTDMTQWETAVSLGVFTVNEWKIIPNPKLKHLIAKTESQKYKPNTVKAYTGCIRQIIASMTDGVIEIDKAKDICRKIGYTPLKTAVANGIFYAAENKYVLNNLSKSAINKRIDEAFQIAADKPSAFEHLGNLPYKPIKPTTVTAPDPKQIAAEISSDVDAKELARMWTSLGDYKMAISVLKKITTCLLLFVLMSFASCKGDSESVEMNIMGSNINVTNGDHNYFVKTIGNDSLFVNIVTGENFGGKWRASNTWSYLYFTRSGTVSWETGGKHSQQVTTIKK